MVLPDPRPLPGHYPRSRLRLYASALGPAGRLHPRRRFRGPGRRAGPDTRRGAPGASCNTRAATFRRPRRHPARARGDVAPRGADRKIYDLDSDGEGWVPSSAPRTTVATTATLATEVSDDSSIGNDIASLLVSEPDDASSDSDPEDALQDPLHDMDAALCLADDSARWHGVCAFFCYDPARTVYDQGIVLPGTTMALRPVQMDAVFRYLQQGSARLSSPSPSSLS